MLQIQKNNDVICKGFKLEKNGLTPVGNPTFKDWEEVGKFISRSSEAVQFWRGDWLNYGENNYDQWTQYFGKDQAAFQTLYNEKYISSRIPPERRRPGLSWSHHRTVADLTAEEQDKMLDIAEQKELSVAEFIREVRHYKLKLDLPELSDDELQKTDPKIFEDVQKVIDSSISTIEMMEKLPWDQIHVDARDFLISHLKRAAIYYLDISKKYTYDRQKHISSGVV